MESLNEKKEFIFDQQQPFDSINISIKKSNINIIDKQIKKLKSSKSISMGNLGLNCSKKDTTSRIHLSKVPSNTKRNARERKRVRTINDYFNQLQKYLPYSKQSTTASTPGPKKLSKVETLKAAIEFIEYLQQFAPINKNSQNLTSPNSNSVSSASYLSSPTSTGSFTSNLSLVEKLKIKCESVDSKLEKKGQFKDNVIEGQILYDSSFDNNTSLIPTNTVSQIYPNDAQNSDIYYNYNSKSYQYAQINHQVTHLTQNSNGYSSFNSQLNEAKLYKGHNSSPTYSTSSSECYGSYNQNGIPDVSMPVDYNNNNVCFNRFPNENQIMAHQYPHYTIADNQNVQYC